MSSSSLHLKRGPDTLWRAPRITLLPRGCWGSRVLPLLVTVPFPEWKGHSHPLESAPLGELARRTMQSPPGHYHSGKLVLIPVSAQLGKYCNRNTANSKTCDRLRGMERGATANSCLCQRVQGMSQPIEGAWHMLSLLQIWTFPFHCLLFFLGLSPSRSPHLQVPCSSMHACLHARTHMHTRLLHTFFLLCVHSYKPHVNWSFLRAEEATPPS